MSYAATMEKYKKQVPDEAEDILEELVGQGKSPSTVAAAIEYVTTDKTQRQVMEEYGVSHPAIRNTYELVAYALDIDLNEIGYRGKETMADVVRDIADMMDWEEGTQYSINSKRYGSGKSGNIQKQGAIELRDKLKELLGDNDQNSGDEQ